MTCDNGTLNVLNILQMIKVERVKTFGSEKTEKCQLDKVSEVKWRLFEKILDNLVLGQPLHVD